ncbi:MAG TPA: C45 family peptidase [Bacteroidia bacterium]|nr:C45 family peptidase [Bacteroidia bacterium]
MMPKLTKWIKFPLYILIGFVVLVITLFVYLLSVALVSAPIPDDLSSLELERKQIDTNSYVIGNNWIRKSNTGIWEMYVEGEAFERGVINGKLSSELVFEQEDAFNDQICKMVPSSFYRGFLKYLIAWFNRDLDENIRDEYKLEIYGVSKSASPKFDYIGPAYQRIMNYHAAHDIGHALQNLALVGCSSFATWNDKSKDKKLIVGRNFDFFVGDKFAENKIALFVNPDQGYKFMMVTWGGMTGVVSGMNMEGLSITLNAAKSDIPSKSATPVSLLAREILQYAKNIDEAIVIAKKRKVFVSESFLIASAYDNKAVNIEITPDTVGIYSPEGNYIICTNHYESEYLAKQQLNKEHIVESASLYRHERIEELLANIPENTPEQTVSVLRNQLGKGDEFIGLGNEKAINQLICHHSIVFEPHSKKVWLSTSPWQLGKFVSYDLNELFAMKGLTQNSELYDTLNTIQADTFMNTLEYNQFLLFRKMKEQITKGGTFDVNRLIKLNPEYYHTYVLAGDYMFREKDFLNAKKFYEISLKKEIATKTEEYYIVAQIEKCNIENNKKK